MDEPWFDLAELIDATPLVPLLYGLAIAACLYTLFSIYSLSRFSRAGAPSFAAAPPAITVLKPLYGDEPGLLEHLTSFCRQDYAGAVQILFGVHDAEDPAAAVARKIVNALRAGKIEGAPAGMTAELAVDPTRHGANGKVANLINMSRRIEHDLVVLADSDIRVAPDYLARLAKSLAQPGVGLVTCLYRGAPMAGLWSHLGAMWVDYGFLPNVVTGVKLKMANPCIGATIALRRVTLDAIGGFRAIQDQLADDYALGEAVRGIGEKVVLADFAVGHAHAETSLLQLWRREMRWARTIRSLNPLGYIGSAVTFPLAWALLALLAGGFAPTGVILTVAALLGRLTLQDEVDRRFPGLPHALFLSPLRDLLSFAVFVASFVPGQVHWRGRDFSMGANGVMSPVEEEAEGTEAEAA
jgi:ceramide glucosyltransferase